LKRKKQALGLEDMTGGDKGKRVAHRNKLHKKTNYKKTGLFLRER
jgi:hypothetical protein